MTEEVAKIKANKDGTYIDIVPEKCVSAQKAQYDENGRDLLDAESSQTIKGANTFAAKQTFTGGVAVSGTNAIAGNVNMDSGSVAIGSAVTIENHGKITADNTSNTLKVADHNSVLTGNDVLSAKDIMTANGDANNLIHRSGLPETKTNTINFVGKNWITPITLDALDIADWKTQTSGVAFGSIALRDSKQQTVARFTFEFTGNKHVLVRIWGIDINSNYVNVTIADLNLSGE